MIHVIRPLGEGNWKQFQWFLQTILYTFGMLSASIFTGVITGSLGYLLRSIQVTLPIWLVGLLAIGYGLKEVGWLPLPMPQRHWQVPVNWINKMPFLGSLAYGLVIGTGILTYIPYAGFYVWTTLTFVLGSPTLGVLLGMLYGLGRSLSVIFGGILLSDSEKNNIYEVSQYILARTQRWHRFSAYLLFSTGIYLLVV